jgi:anti-anti-sigma regulatory factor
LAITVDIGEAGCVVHLEGEIEIGSAAELKNVLADAIASGKEVRLDLAPGVDLDVTAMQLLWTATREARKAGTSFGVDGQVPEAVSGALSDAGFASFLVTLEGKPGTAAGLKTDQGA